ncbi:MAG TPA: antibiotic biosynthesis monooxygenase [Lutibacter sp.]|nr:antibiotic biosynthesis monooxygenase [Lutibacter sp.]
MNKLFAETPDAPYYAVIFTSKRTEGHTDEYDEETQKMITLLADQKGFLGFETASKEIGITISYWKDIAAIMAWRNNLGHLAAQKKGKESFYEAFKVRIAKVERDYSF